MIWKRISLIHVPCLFLLVVSCDRGRDSTEKPGKPAAQPLEKGTAPQGLVIAAEVERSKDKGETMPFVRPVMPEFVAGSLPQEAIAGEIAGRAEEIRTCYRKGLEAVPGLSGNVTIAFELNDDGAVIVSEVREKTLSHEPTALCIANAMLKWRFPKPSRTGTVKVLYTYSLQPTD